MEVTVQGVGMSIAVGRQAQAATMASVRNANKLRRCCVQVARTLNRRYAPGS